MLEISTDLQVNQPTVTMVGTSFVSIENYLSIITFDTIMIKIKTKSKIIKISGDRLSLKYITDSEIGIKGIIQMIEYID
jgi:sporulation protein YqfC